MKANSKTTTKKTKVLSKTGKGLDTFLLQKESNSEVKFSSPKYNSMKQEIEKISDPIPFEELKGFYGLE